MPARSDAAVHGDVTPTPRPGRAVRIIAALVTAAAVLALLAAVAPAAAAWAVQGESALAFPYPLNYGEGPLLDQAVRLRAGGALYAVPGREPPYTVTNYPPLYMLAQVPFIAAGGPSFAPARAISLVSLVVAVLAAGMVCAALTRDRAAGLIAGALVFAVPYFTFWSALARIDTLALALSLGGAACAVVWPGRAAAVAGAAVLCALAAYTRQTYLLAAPMAVFAYLWGGQWRYNAALFAVTFGALCVGALAALVLLTRGGFIFHVVTANVNALDSALLTVYADELARAFPILLAGGAAVLVFGPFVRPTPRDESGHPRPAAWWFVGPYLLGGLVSALNIAKIGSDANYLYELCLGLALAAGVVAAALGRLPAVLVGLPRALWVGLLVVQVGWLGVLNGEKYVRFIPERVAQRAAIDALFAAVQAEPGPVLADEYLGLLPLAGRPIVFQPFEMGQLAAAGLWDDAPLADAIRQGDYPLLLLYQPSRNPGLRFERWTRPLLAAINDAYRPAGNQAETTLYRLAAP